MTASPPLCLKDEIEVEVLFDRRLSARPRLDICELSLIIAPFRDAQDHESFVLATTGSGTWYRSEYDEVRFDRDTKLLVGVWCHVPEVNTSSDVVTAWCRAPVRSGLLRSLGPVDFDLLPSSHRSVSIDGSALAFVNKVETKGERLRLRITKGVYMLFSNSAFRGWLVENPERFLVKDFAFPDDRPADPDLARLMADYLLLVEADNIQRVEQGDPAVIEALIDLRKEVLSRDSSGAGILRDCIDRVIDQFLP